MASLTPMSVYICANILLALAAAVLGGIRAVSPLLRQPIAYRHQLRLGEAMAAGAVLLPLVGCFSRRAGFLPQAAQVWAAPTMRTGALPAPEGHRTVVSFVSSGASVPLDRVSQAVAVLFLAGLLFSLARLARDVIATAQIIADAQEIRRLGRSRVLASERVPVPFSFWVPARYFIVVPSALALRYDDLMLAIRHEAQHHRQQDTKVLYLYQLLKAAFFWNPAVHRLEGQLRELQEFSCDEALGARRSISVQGYCQCLLRVAEAAARERHAWVHASMIKVGAGNVLERRIKAMLTRRTGCLRRSAVCAAGAAALTLMGTAALAFTSTINDRRISAEQAGRMAAAAREGSSFPIVVNARVVTQLNLLLSTPDGRAYLQASLERMHSYEAFISEQLVLHGMPLELLAVPLAERGYRNLPQSDDLRDGAGLWMFIVPTARQLGLIVDVSCDERLNVTAETGAAIRLLSSLYRQFGDWGLALLAYNAGDVRVERAIAETGSRDVWELIDRGYENEPDYVPRVMAAALIIKNPGVLD